jgi:SynChlorMet cassette radical SAM/SPASM protein ScmF
VKLSGGEPLLHPQFKTLLKIVRREAISLRIETNGVLCTPELAKEITKSPKRFVAVSIDGADAATHDSIRGVPGSFKLALDAISNLVAAGTRPQIIMSLMHCNANQVDPVVRMAESLGASSLKFNIVQPTARGEVLRERAGTLDIKELIRLGRHVYMELAPATKLRLIFDYPMAFRPLSRIASGDARGTCGILGILGVLPSGHYALCGIGKHVPDLVFGIAGKDKLEEVWRENTFLRQLRAELPHRLEGVCARCLMKQRCLGSCIAQNYYRSGSPWKPFWFCEEAEASGLFPGTRLALAAV